MTLSSRASRLRATLPPAGPRTLCILAVCCLALDLSPALAQGRPTPTIPTTPSKAEPSPVVDSIASGAKPLIAPEHRTSAKKRRHLLAHRRHGYPLDMERPALAGVLLTEPIPPRVAPPRPIVPAPAYFVDGFVAAFTIAPPPLRCRPRPRDPDEFDPRLYREVPLACAPDIE